MRTFLFVVLMLSAAVTEAQSYNAGWNPDHQVIRKDSASAKKWSLQKYTGVSSSVAFFNGVNLSMFSVPIGLQLNRRLTNNLYAFASASFAPTYLNINASFMGGDFTKSSGVNGFSRTGIFGVYSRAALGLQYVNDDRTFSISGSVGVSRGSYPMMPYGVGSRQF